MGGNNPPHKEKDMAKLALLRAKLQIGSINPGNVASFSDEPREDPKREGIEFPSIAKNHEENRAAVRLSCAEALGLNTDGPRKTSVIHLTPANCLLHGYKESEIKEGINKLPPPTLEKMKALMAGELKKKASPLLGIAEGPSLEAEAEIIRNMSPEEIRGAQDLLESQKKRLGGLEKRLAAAGSSTFRVARSRP
jgi:hypothetical protein